MSVKICPNCGERYVVSFDSSDYIHECSSDNIAIDQDDIVVIGNWEDFTGSQTVPPQQVLMQGAENKLFGTLPSLEGENLDTITRLGNRASTHRQRQHYEYIESEMENSS